MVSKDITKVEPAGSLVKPDYLGDEIQGIEELSKFVTPPRIKIVQKQADSSLLELFGVGDVILSPANVLIIEMGRTTKGQPTGEAPPLVFTPIFFFPEWCVWNPYELKGSVLAIRDRTLDPNHNIAVRARDKNLWHEPCSENPEYNIRYVEHLNFVVVIHGSEFTEPVILSFARSGHASGRQLSNLIKMRKASIYSCTFEARLAPNSNEQGDWWGFNVENPSTVAPWVTEDQNLLFKAAHEEFVTLHQGGRIRVDHEDVEPKVEAESQY